MDRVVYDVFIDKSSLESINFTSRNNVTGCISTLQGQISWFIDRCSCNESHLMAQVWS
jgi:hypothetical protein